MIFTSDSDGWAAQQALHTWSSGSGKAVSSSRTPLPSARSIMACECVWHSRKGLLLILTSHTARGKSLVIFRIHPIVIRMLFFQQCVRAICDQQTHARYKVGQQTSKLVVQDVGVVLDCLWVLVLVASGSR